jgi:hypothetical protein
MAMVGRKLVSSGFSITLSVDERRCIWITYLEANEDDCDIEEDKGQMATEVKIAFPVSHNILTSAEEYIK